MAVPEREQDVTVLGDENADRTILLGAPLAVRAQGFQRHAVQRHYRNGYRLREQLVELDDVAGLETRFEVAPIFFERHRQSGNEMRSLGEPDPRHQPVGAFGERRENDDGSVAFAAQIIAPQAGDDGGDFMLELGHVLIAQVAMPGDADHQGQTVRHRFHGVLHPAEQAMRRRRPPIFAP